MKIKTKFRWVVFQVSDVEREGFFRCLNLFRVAQQHELKKDSCNSDDLINALYEECLTIRYSYLARGILKWENKGSENEDGAKLFCETREHIISDNKSVASDKTVQTHLEVPERNIENCDENSINAFLILSLEMWQSIISYLCVDVACKNLVIVFPILDEIKKNVEKSLIMAKVEYNWYFYMLFLQIFFIVELHNEDCFRVLVVYSIVLLRHDPSSKTYTAHYNPDTNEVVFVPLKKTFV